MKSPKCAIVDDDVERTLQDIRKRNADYVGKVGGESAALGDRVTVDFVGEIDGATFAGGSASDQQIVLGDGNMLKAFEDGLIGASRSAMKNESAWIFRANIRAPKSPVSAPNLR